MPNKFMKSIISKALDKTSNEREKTEQKLTSDEENARNWMDSNYFQF